MSESCSVRSPERSSDLTSPPPPHHHLRRARLQQPLVAAAMTKVKRRESIGTRIAMIVASITRLLEEKRLREKIQWLGQRKFSRFEEMKD
ncbi:hypothetical protein ACSBR1_007865 [Camellia fascicularis]